MDLTEKMDQVHKYGPSGSPDATLPHSIQCVPGSKYLLQNKFGPENIDYDLIQLLPRGADSI